MNTTSLLNLGEPDLIIILFIVLMILFGAKKWPELFRGMEQAVREFRQIFTEAIPEWAKANDAPGTAFGLVAVIVALVLFLFVAGARLSGG